MINSCIRDTWFVTGITLDSNRMIGDIWVKVFKNEPSKMCGRQPLKSGCLPQNLLGPFLNNLFHMFCAVFSKILSQIMEVFSNLMTTGLTIVSYYEYLLGEIND